MRLNRQQHLKHLMGCEGENNDLLKNTNSYT